MLIIYSAVMDDKEYNECFLDISLEEKVDFIKDDKDLGKNPKTFAITENKNKSMYVFMI